MRTATLLYETLCAGGVLGLLLICALLFRKKNSLANRFLSAVILCELYTQTIDYLDYTAHIIRYPFLFRSNFVVALLGAPLLYFYVCSLTVPNFRLKRRDFWHVLPVTFGVLWYVIPYVFFRHRDLWTLSDDFFFERQFRMGGWYFYSRVICRLA